MAAVARAWAVLAIWLLASHVEATQTVNGTVRRALDGDTVIVSTAARNRLRCCLAGIDAPEVSHRGRDGVVTPGQPYGPEAKSALEGIFLRRSVTVEVRGSDRYRRPLCILWAGGRNLNAAMVRDGYAWALRENSADVSPDRPLGIRGDTLPPGQFLPTLAFKHHFEGKFHD